MLQVQGEKRKVCCFSLEREAELFTLANELNFSAFVKRHLMAELARRKQQAVTSQITVRIDEEE